MNKVWQKLNLKNQTEILVVNAPHSFDAGLEQLDSVKIVRSCGKVKTIEFILAFVTKLAEVERFTKQIAKKAEGDALVWFAYPKQSSKNYRCDFNRDSGWQSLGKAGFEGVRQIAIDEDWSAIRFRRVEFFKSMTRNQTWAQTAEGKVARRRLPEASRRSLLLRVPTAVSSHPLKPDEKCNFKSHALASSFQTES